MNEYTFKVFEDGNLCGEGFGFGANAFEAAETGVKHGTLSIQGCVEVVAINVVTGLGFKFEMAQGT